MTWTTIIQKAIENKEGIKEANNWWIRNENGRFN